jgi:hypothetical protein
MKPEDLQLGQCEQGARLVIMNPGERKVKFTTPPEKP